MNQRISNEDLMRYLDDELEPPDRARVDDALTRSTELQRELAIYRAIRDDVADLSFSPSPRDQSVWGEVNREITRPVGWFLLITGSVIFVIYAAVVYATSDANPWEKIGVGGIVIGFSTLLISTIYERVQEYRHDPYKHIER